MSTKHVCVLTPRDGLFLKDGRGWYTSSLGNGRTLDWPMPSTIHAALRSSVGREWERNSAAPLEAGNGENGWVTVTEQVQLDRVLALRRPVSESGERWSSKHRIWPVPADAFFSESQAEGIARLNPQPPGCVTLGRESGDAAYDEAREALWRAAPADKAKPGQRPTWWSEGAFVRWLAGEVLDATARREPLGFNRLPIRPRTHLAVDPRTATAEDGKLYGTESVEFLRFANNEGRQGDGAEEWAIGVEVALPNDRQLGTTLAVGGKRRFARLDRDAATDLFGEMPAKLSDAFAQAFQVSNLPRRLRLVVVSPTEFKQGWLPDGMNLQDGQFRGPLPIVGGEKFGTWILRAAMVGRPMAVSGWDMAKRSPKPTQRLVPPGSVYYFEQVGHGDASAPDLKEIWLARTSAAALGCVVPGVWPHSS